jgi:hypothetical protein
MALDLDLRLPIALPVEAPSRRGRIVLLSVLAGLALAVVWSASLVDGVIGRSISDGVLGTEAEEMVITTSLMGAIFAFVTGVAGTFTACNIAVFGAIAPMVAQKQSFSRKLLEVLKPIGWLTLGAVAVAGLYGAIGVYIDGIVPQLSDARIGDPENGLRVRLIQASVVFGVIGVFLIYRGLIALELAPNPLARLFARHPRADLVIMGGIIGAFLIGRPFGLFRHMYEYAGSTNNPIIGFTTFGLQAVGNIVLVSALFLLLVFGTGGRFQRWLGAKPGRLATLTAVAMIVGGVFFVAYWDIRLPARVGGWWWPTMPWNT